MFPTITINPVLETVTSVVGDTIQYNCTATGYPPPLITWTHADTQLPQDISTSTVDYSNPLPSVLSVLTLTYLNLTNEGQYYCMASNDLVTEQTDTSGLANLELQRELSILEKKVTIDDFLFTRSTQCIYHANRAG